MKNEQPVKVALDEATLDQLAAVQEALGKEQFPSLDGLLSFMVNRYHAVYVEPRSELAADWQLRDDLSLEDLEAFWTSLLKEANQHKENGSDSMWSRYGRYIRAAVRAGWVISPEIAVGKDGRLTPSPGRNAEKLGAIMGLIDSHYTAILLEGSDPN